MTSQFESKRLKHTPQKENDMKRIENNIVETTSIAIPTRIQFEIALKFYTNLFLPSKFVF